MRPHKSGSSTYGFLDQIQMFLNPKTKVNNFTFDELSN